LLYVIIKIKLRRGEAGISFHDRLTYSTTRPPTRRNKMKIPIQFNYFQGNHKKMTVLPAQNGHHK